MLNKLIAATLYTALSLTAIAAQAYEVSELEELREGKMRNLVFHSEPQPVSQIPFLTEDGAEIVLSDYQGRFVVLNFWATWCAPCREEMPSLDRLSADFADHGVDVISIASGRNPMPAIKKFYETAGLETLPILLDPKGKLSRDMNVLALPITVIIDRDGREIARMKGDADWYSESAISILNALITEQ